MKTIYKHAIPIDDWQEINLPVDAKILTAREQGNVICIWYETDTNTHTQPPQTVEIAIFGTGHDMGKKWMHDREPIYLGTCFFENGKTVFHVYHLKPKTYWSETP